MSGVEQQDRLAELEPTIRRAAIDIAPIFDRNQWKWRIGGPAADAVVPDVFEIAHTIRYLVESVINTQPEPNDEGYWEFTHGTGRIVVTRDVRVSVDGMAEWDDITISLSVRDADLAELEATR